MSSIFVKQEKREPHIDPGLYEVANYLRGRNSGFKLHHGIEENERIDYFKGKRAIDSLLRLTYKKDPKRPAVRNRQDAIKLCQKLLENGFFHRSTRISSKRLEIHRHQEFVEDGYYRWTYEGPQTMRLLLGVLLVVFALVCVLFPIWPLKLRIFVWYLSMGFLIIIGLFFLMAIVRLLLYIITKVLIAPGIWIFPNLFEDVSFLDSFKPGWDWEIPKSEESSKKKSKSQSEKNNKEVLSLSEDEKPLNIKSTSESVNDELQKKKQ